MNKLIKLCDITKEIFNKYNEILTLTTDITIDNSSINIQLPQDVLEANYIKYASLIKQRDDVMTNLIKETSKVLDKKYEELELLVIEENKILNSIDIDCIDKYCDKLENLSERYYYTVIDRVRERLMLRGIILNGNNIMGRDFLDNTDIENLEFDTHDVTLAMVHIEVLKILKNKLDNISNLTKENIMFKREVDACYERSKFEYFNNIPTLELIALVYNADMSKVPSIDINNIKENENIDEEEVDEFLVRMVQDTLDAIVNINDSDLEYSLTDSYLAFDYLFNITLFEVIISYMDIQTLQEVSEYCNSFTKDNNKIHMGNINNLVKRKLKD